ncbi:hypothetical protein C8F04DRAFT_1096196 [Mycena alexandri]|uniref:Uncharacterized protein n=1 Tax=Mycena alexandri TaxID=1745969 RepID=A0AAD6X248_9AGAR|nr:hypothetical protein C8F04DRAFT_1096196 [Mycena alexandri]
MVALRIRRTGTLKLTTTTGRGYLLKAPNLRLVQIKTEMKVPVVAPTLAANIGLDHIHQRVQQLPYLVVQDIFSPNADHIHDCVVQSNGQRFLICAWYKSTAAVNGALKEFAPGYDWRGEIIVVQLGRRVAFSQKVKTDQVKVVVNKFISGYLFHMHAKQPIPSAMV